MRTLFVMSGPDHHWIAPYATIRAGPILASSGRSVTSAKVAVVIGLLGLLLAAGTAHAHAELVAAEPAPGTLLARSPRMIRLQFSEALRSGSGVVVFGTGFRSVPGIEAAVDLTKPTRLVATLPELAPDNYTVQWTSVSIDGDTLSGSYAFGVQAPLPRPTQLNPALLALLLVLVLLAAALVTRRRWSRVAVTGPKPRVDNSKE